MALLDDQEAAAAAGAAPLGPEEEQQLPSAASSVTTAQQLATAGVATSSSSDPAAPDPATAATVVERLFRGTVCLAPMVRAGTLPFRLLCLSYGADTVWGEEIIDRKMLDCERRPNPRLGTIDFVNRKDGRLVFQTCPAAEKGRVIFQLGASPRNPEWAVRAALLVAGDVAGVDVNMGCPKKFSVQDGMGAALLENEAGAASLIRALRAALPPHVPVTCKIRLLDTPERTVAFARAMQAAGCAAIGVHMRTRTDKASGAARWDAIKPVVDGLSIPVVANGDIYTREHLAAVRAAAGRPDLAVMLARPALYNPSVFRTLKQEPHEGGLQALDEAMRAFVRLCLRFENHVSNTKYILCEMLCRKRHPDHLRNALPIEPPPGKTIPVLSTLKTSAAIAALWGLDPEAEGPTGSAPTADAAAADAQERPGLHVYSDAYFAAAEGSTVEGDGAGVGAKRGALEQQKEEEPAGGEREAKRARAD